MNTAEIVLIAAVLVLFGYVFYSRRIASGRPTDSSVVQLLNDIRRDLDEVSAKNRTELQTRIDRIDDRIAKSMNDSLQLIQKQSTHTSGIVRDVTEKLTKLDETNKQVLDFSKQLQSLENILKNPKQRGILGEYWLETLLGQVLQPMQYKMQYDLGVDENGSKLIPDAVIFVKEMLIPIDAKFSLENYNKISLEIDLTRKDALEREFKGDVKKRIDETSKYIRPERGTTNFAFMFVPAEGVYHNLITSNVGAVNVNTRNLIEYAFEKGVMIVSPTSFFAYLQTVLLGLRALQIEDSVKEIQQHAEHLNRHLKAYEEYHGKVGKHLETTVRAYNESNNELKKIDKDIFKVTAGTAGRTLIPPQIDKGNEVA
ncbi:hypothetical protein A2856_01095 [Candidatus Uhrbacteria bacterium RIFCSPHIGHO2_01_FULL_63_20]|uniref:Recombinase RmuC n=1 Tax=Candidatus Uhrbacteria bacterium RIFCSPHIGHO2_01_FULL_63_20 TaxID=1802385 RepID=A0A1F7TM67_9BACT|nr:MAG: hypothetical protein A2856_01095 [Candidatus Uhrbacteria bacterium RIFCSPHIGHO2_01_FULL_63_20]